MFASIAHRYDLANHLLSGGLDYFWRKRTARIVRGWGSRLILDLATGSGDIALELAAACPLSTVIGADFCHAMLSVAKRKGAADLVTADALRLPFDAAAFDAITVAFGLRNMEPLSAALREMARVLRPGGHLLVLDFSLPPPPLRWIYRPYLHAILPRIASLLTGQKGAYDYLADSIEAFPRGSAMCTLIDEAGFSQTACEPLSGGIVSLYTATRL